MAEALAVVNVGKREWLLAKLAPCVRIQYIVGESIAFTEPARNPSNTKIRTLRGCAPAGLFCPTRNAGRTAQNASPTASESKAFFIRILFVFLAVLKCQTESSSRAARESK